MLGFGVLSQQLRCKSLAVDTANTILARIAIARLDICMSSHSPSDVYLGLHLL